LLKQNDLPVELQLIVRVLNTIANTATAKITYAESEVNRAWCNAALD